MEARDKVAEEWLVKDYGWKVRRLRVGDEAETSKAAFVQAQAFHTPMAFFDDLFFEFFKVTSIIYLYTNIYIHIYACV